MNFNITTNRELDETMIEEFFNSGSSVIYASWPALKSAADIPKILDSEYGGELNDKIKLLKANTDKLNLIASAISTVMGEPWAPIDKINIWVGACPIAPRFLDIHSFLMPYHHDLDYMITTSTHEMIHFLYFKKWASLFPEHKPEMFESPHPVWVLSEILAVIIGNDARIKDVIGNKSELYPNWQEVKVEGQGLTEPYVQIHKTCEDFDAFLKESWIKYQELDKKHNVTSKLTENTF